MQFQNTTLSAEMLQAIATQNFTEMTEIQAKTIQKDSSAEVRMVAEEELASAALAEAYAAEE